MTKAYVFRLATLLRLRRAELDQAELQLATANARLRSLIAERAIALGRYEELARLPMPANVEHFARERAAADLAAAAVLVHDDKINVAAAEAALAHLAWGQANRKVAALERLEENRREEWRLDSARREANELDELATAAFVRESHSSATA